MKMSFNAFEWDLRTQLNAEPMRILRALNAILVRIT